MWQPIETAPMHREVLVWRADAGVLLAMYTSLDQIVPESQHHMYDADTLEQGDWFCADFYDGSRLEGDEAPTYWMPLPDEPTTPAPAGNAPAEAGPT